MLKTLCKSTVLHPVKLTRVSLFRRWLWQLRWQVSNEADATTLPGLVWKNCCRFMIVWLSVLLHFLGASPNLQHCHDGVWSYHQTNYTESAKGGWGQYQALYPWVQSYPVPPSPPAPSTPPSPLPTKFSPDICHCPWYTSVALGSRIPVDVNLCSQQWYDSHPHFSDTTNNTCSFVALVYVIQC